MGDALPSEIYNTTYKTIHTPKKVEIPQRNVLRDSAINLVGKNPMTYLTDYRDNFIPLKNNPNKNDEINDLIKNIRKSHFNFGETKNDYGTTSGLAFKFDPEEAKKSNNKLNNELLKDLQSTHYKLGYDNDFGESSQKKDFIPYQLNESRLNRSSMRNSYNFIENNIFDGISIYKSDYTKKELPEDDNDCLC